MSDDGGKRDLQHAEYEALQERYDLYRSIVETTQEGIWFVDPRGRTLFANRRMMELLGCTAEELYAADVFDFLDEDGRRIAKGYLANGFADVTPEREVRFLRKDGNVLWLLLSSNPVFDTQGRYTGALAMANDITPRKHAERDLRDIRERMTQILNLADDAVVSMDEQHRIILFNQGAERIFGYAAQEVLGQPLELLVPEAQRAAHRKSVEGFAHGAVASRRMAERSPVRARRKDGSVFPAEASVSRFRQGPGMIFTAYLRDITRREHAEKALRESERLFRRLVEGSLQGIWIHRDNRILFASQSLADMFGFDGPEQMMAQIPVNEMIAPVDRPRLWDYYQRRMEGQPVPTRYEFRCQRRDGELFWMEVLVGETWWDGGKAVLATGVDISERKRAEEALRESEARLRLLTNAVPVGICYIDLHQRFRFANATFSGWYQRPPEEFVDCAVAQILPQADYELANPHLARALLGERADFEGVINHPVGGKRHIHATHVPDKSPDGGVRGVSVMIEDITQRRAMEEQFRQAQKMEALGKLAGGIAHDLNNILVPILGYAELLYESMPPEREERTFATTVIESAYRARDLVSQILLFSRRGRAAKRVCDVGVIVREVIKLVRPTQPKAIIIDEAIAENLDSIYCDPTQMHQLLLNLLVNAVQAVGQGGHVLLTAENVQLEGLECFTGKRLTGRHVRLAVSDDGVGMDEATLAQIFDPFFSTKEPGAGTGLGLSTSFGIVQEHDGGIRVESRLGYGATFEVFLPADARAPNSAPTPGAIPRGTETVLVVDDEEPIVALYSRVLPRWGYAAVGTTSSAEALRWFQAEPGRFDLVITDQSMPGLNGNELTAELRALRPDVPVILCTGYSDTMTPERARELGIDALLHKPVAPEEMGRVVREVMDRAARLRAGPAL
ncbi:MAG: PAS domain S-box protein [Candidatus Lambdaproteobacteria bacterium]|nr:PAS domain S-box protein [Candidatus Lambdaproteobacteria bacterium]